MPMNDHVVKLYDIIVEGEIKISQHVEIFMVMEYFEQDLKNLLDNADSYKFIEVDAKKIIY